MNNDENFLALYLKQNLQRVKSECNKNLQYLSYATLKIKNKETGDWYETNGFRFTLLNSDNGREKIEVGLNKPYSDFNLEDYNNLITIINDKKYNVSN